MEEALQKATIEKLEAETALVHAEEKLKSAEAEAISNRFAPKLRDLIDILKPVIWTAVAAGTFSLWFLNFYKDTFDTQLELAKTGIEFAEKDADRLQQQLEGVETVFQNEIKKINDLVEIRENELSDTKKQLNDQKNTIDSLNKVISQLESNNRSPTESEITEINKVKNALGTIKTKIEKSENSVKLKSNSLNELKIYQLVGLWEVNPIGNLDKFLIKIDLSNTGDDIYVQRVKKFGQIESDENIRIHDFKYKDGILDIGFAARGENLKLTSNDISRNTINGLIKNDTNTELSKKIEMKAELKLVREK